MAQRVTVQLEDDLSGGPAAETVTFGLDGVSYELDLNEQNAAALRDALASYIAAARRVRRAGSPAGRRRGGGEPRAVRAWAAGRGIEVPARGRIPRTVVEEYQKAHG